MKSADKCRKKLYKYSDVTALFYSLLAPRYLIPFFITISIIGMSATQIVSNPYSNIYPYSLFASTVLALIILTNKCSYEIEELNFTQPRILITIWFLLFSSFVFLHYIHGGASGVVRANMLLLYSVSILLIFLSGKTFSGVLLVMLTGLVHRYTIHLSSSIPFGNDPHVHNRITGEIATLGSLETLLNRKYFYSPFSHIYAATGEIITGVSTFNIRFIVFSILILTVPSLIIYSIVSFFWTEDAGAIGVILYIAADFVIWWSVLIHVVGPASVVGILVIFAYLWYIIMNQIRYLFLFFIFLVTLTSYHQASSFIVVLAIVSISLVNILQNKSRIVSFRTSAIALLSLIFDWLTTRIQGPFGTDEVFFERIISGTISRIFFRNIGTYTRPEVSLAGDPSITGTGAASLTNIHVIGSAMLFSFVIISIVLVTSGKCENRMRSIAVSISVSVGIMYILIFGGSFVGFSYFQPQRWFIYMYFLMIIIGAPIVIRMSETICGLFNCKKSIYIGVIFSILLIYISLMGGNYVGAPNGPVFDSAHGAERLSYNELEVAQLEHAANYSPEDGRQFADFRSSQALRLTYQSATDIVRVDQSTNQIQIPDGGTSLVLYRDYMSTKHTQYSLRMENQSIRVHGKVPVESLNTMKFNKVYQSEPVNHSGIFHSSS